MSGGVGGGCTDIDQYSLAAWKDATGLEQLNVYIEPEPVEGRDALQLPILEISTIGGQPHRGRDPCRGWAAAKVEWHAGEAAVRVWTGKERKRDRECHHQLVW